MHKKLSMHRHHVQIGHSVNHVDGQMSLRERLEAAVEKSFDDDFKDKDGNAKGARKPTTHKNDVD